jgi:LEA14-like dessication related protein
MDLRALLQGSRLKAAVSALLVVTASIGGAVALGVLGTPGVAAVENRFGPVDQETTVIETDLVVDNPNPVGVTLGDTTVNYTVGMNGVAIASGRKEGLDVDRGNTTLNFTTRMRNGKIPEWWVTHVRNDERTTLVVDATARTGLLGGLSVPFEERKEVETDVIGQFDSNETRPVSSSEAPPVVPSPLLYVNSTSANWGEVTGEETPIDMTFTLYNPHLQPYAVSELGYEITMNGVEVGTGRTQEEPAIVIPGRTETALDTRTVIRNPALDDWWVSHLQRDQVTDLRIDFYAILELPSGNTLRVPLDELTYEQRIETDVFGTKNASAGNGTVTPGGTPTADATPTPTADATPTDDGLVSIPTDTAPPGTDTTDGGLFDGTPTPDTTPSADGTTSPTPTDDGLLSVAARDR